MLQRAHSRNKLQCLKKQQSSLLLQMTNTRNFQKQICCNSKEYPPNGEPIDKSRRLRFAYLRKLFKRQNLSEKGILLS